MRLLFFRNQHFNHCNQDFFANCLESERARATRPTTKLTRAVATYCTLKKQDVRRVQRRTRGSLAHTHRLIVFFFFAVSNACKEQLFSIFLFERALVHKSCGDRQFSYECYVLLLFTIGFLSCYMFIERTRNINKSFEKARVCRVNGCTNRQYARAFALRCHSIRKKLHERRSRAHILSTDGLCATSESFS